MSIEIGVCWGRRKWGCFRGTREAVKERTYDRGMQCRACVWTTFLCGDGGNAGASHQMRVRHAAWRCLVQHIS